LIEWLMYWLIDWYLHLLTDWRLTPVCAVLYTTANVYIHFILYFVWFTLHCMSFILHRLKFIIYCIQSYTVESHYLELTLTVFVDNMKQITGPHVVFFILPYHNELEYFFIDSYKTMFIFFFIFATSLTLVITGSS